MNRCCILVLSRYADLFEAFRHQVDILAPHTYKILIRSGEEIKPPEDFHWLTEQGDEPFNFSRNCNMGFRTAGLDDVLLCGDDVRIYTPKFVEIMAEVAYSDEMIGLVTPNIGQSPFVCCYIKREILNAVGNLDENFDGYGFEDMDFFRRMEARGYRTQPTDLIGAEHVGGTSFYRREHEGGPCVETENARVRELYQRKWENK
jgi:hypothetical protein